SHLPSLIGEFELETLASAARGHRVPDFALLEDEAPDAVLVRAPAVGQAPGRKPVARPPRFAAQAGVELRQHRERQRVLARRTRRGEELGAMALDQARVEIGADEIPILHEPPEKSEIGSQARDLEFPERLAHSLERRRAIPVPDDKL